MSQRLQKAGFCELIEGEKWTLKKGGSYFVQRNQASLIAFHLPKKKMEEGIIIGAHTDSPCLKVKPNGESEKNELILLNFEVYGGPILASWFNRDLILAGRVFYKSSKGKGAIESRCVCLDKHPIMIPQLAIHLNRDVNEAGFVLNKQEHLTAIACSKSEYEGSSYLKYILQKELGAKAEILHYELFAIPFEEPRFLGANGELMASFRLDNLASCQAALDALLSAKPQDNKLLMTAFWNHEEVGSESSEGAASSFFSDTIERIAFHLDMDTEAFLRFKANSFTLSIDVTHATHPNYEEKHDLRHKVFLGKGLCLKTNAQERYTSHGEIVSKLIALWQEKGIPFQTYVSRNDIPSGTTIGPIHAARTGIRSMDIGIPLLSMHASRELIHRDDQKSMTQALQHLMDQ